jgi:predicted ATP-grasp superfamily ATP-dependent carboligase
MACRVVVTDVHDRAGFGTCRSLSSAGFLVAGVASERPAPGHWSRSCSERFNLVDPRVDPVRYVEELESIVSRGRYAVLVPGSDASLLAVSERRGALESHVRLGLPPDEVVRRALDKRTLLAAAAEAGIACPETVVCSTRRAAFDAARELGFPVIVKPRSTVFRDRGTFAQVGSLRADDRAALEFSAGVVGRPFLLQRAERGDQYSVGGVIAEGKLIATAVSRYIRTWPVTSGRAAFSETVTPPKGLIDRVERLAADIGWQGIFEVELIRRADGTFAAIDINPRLYGSIVLAHAAGAPIPALWCDWLLGRKPAAVVARAGFRYRWEDADVRHAFWQIRHRNPRGALSVFRPHRRVVHAHARLADPAPLLARFILLIRRRRGGPDRHFRRSSLPAVGAGQSAPPLVKDT